MPQPYGFVDPNDARGGGQQVAPAPVQAPVPAPEQNPNMPVQGPPKTAEERAARVTGWEKFLDKLQNDPATQQMIMQASTTMLQGQRPGEDFNGLLGRSLQGGNLAGQFINQNQRAAQVQDDKLNLEADRVDNQADLIEIQGRTSQEVAATSRQKRELALKLFPQLQKKTEAELVEMEGKAAKMDLDLVGYADKLRLERDVSRAKIGASEADTKLRKEGTLHNETTPQTIERWVKEGNSEALEAYNSQIEARREAALIKEGAFTQDQLLQLGERFLQQGKKGAPLPKGKKGATGTVGASPENPHLNQSDAKEGEYAVTGWDQKTNKPIIRKKKFKLVNQ